MRHPATCTSVAVLLALSLGLAGCEKEKGPAEKLGAKIDAAASDAKAAAEKAADDVRKAAEEVKEDLEE